MRALGDTVNLSYHFIPRRLRLNSICNGGVENNILEIICR